MTLAKELIKIQWLENSFIGMFFYNLLKDWIDIISWHVASDLGLC